MSFKRFRYRLPEVLGELYFVATKEGKIKTLKDARKWLNEQERVDAPQVAAKRWKSIKLEHDGREIRLRDWRDFPREIHPLPPQCGGLERG